MMLRALGIKPPDRGYNGFVSGGETCVIKLPKAELPISPKRAIPPNPLRTWSAFLGVLFGK